MISDVENLFMYLLAICVSSQEKMSIQICPCFNGMICFIAAKLREFLKYILDFNLLVDI